MAETVKARYWTAVGYTECMDENWAENISDVLEVEYCYCLHDKDPGKKPHVHILLCYGNVTTYNTILQLVNQLSKPGERAFNTVKVVRSVEHLYNYLIHDTESCRKQGKLIYPVEKRIAGNDFNIANYTKISHSENNAMVKEICNIIIENRYVRFGDVYTYVIENLQEEYFEVLRTNVYLFTQLCKSNYLKQHI